MRVTPLLAACLASTALVSTAVAQEAFELGEITVSGGLSPIQSDRLGRASSVLTARDIEEKGVTNVQDALRAVPGVSVNGASNSFTQVRIRGSEAGHALILIDGIEAAGGDGEYILSGLETANIERIEVLRGPQSVVYGSAASAGVINIITDKGSDGTTARGSIELGDATIATAFAAYRNDRGGIAFGLSHTDDKGYDQSGDNGEKDSLERTTLTLSGDYMLGEDLLVGFTLRHSDEQYDYDRVAFGATDAASYVVDDPTLFAGREELTFGVYAEYFMLDGRMSHRLGYQLTKTDQNDNGGPFTRTEAEALKYRLSYALDGAQVADADHLVNLMLETARDSSSSNPLFERESNSIAVEYRGRFGNGLDLQAGLRHDDNDVFDDATTWTLGLSYTLPESGVRFHASAGTGSVNPSYFDLYANAFGFTGNPNLRPEQNRGFDIGVEVPVLDGRGSFDVTYFNEKLTDEITSVSTGPGTFSFINQAGDSTREGIELSGHLDATDALTLRLAYTYLDARNPNGSVEIRRPKHELNLGAHLETFGGRGMASVNIRHVASNADTQFWGAFSTVDLPDYTTVDLALDYDLTDRVTLTGRVLNAFDTESSDVWGYVNRGRSVYVGLRAQF